MGFAYSAACSCDIGRRGNNEDNFYFDGAFLPIENAALQKVLSRKDTTDRGVAFGVFDGMGGHADGQIASGMAASIFHEVFAAFCGDREVEDFMLQTVKTISSRIWEKADEAFSNMGTTIATVYFVGEQYTLCNVGDSRIFRFRDNRLEQISHDHTDAQFLKKNGIRMKARLTQYLGVCPEELVLEPYVRSGVLSVGDQFLLASDGLTGVLSEKEIALILQSRQPVDGKVTELTQKALKNGGRDNVTMVLVALEASK